MNQMSPLGREPIDLTTENPFRLARTEVTPAALELRRDGDVWTVEPRVMKVLVALHRSRGHAVSREELIDLCWEGRIVGEDSLNRSISQLRKALAAEPGVAINTIARIGYRLRVEAAEEAEPESAPRRPGGRLRIAAIAGLALLACGGGLWWYAAPDGDWSAAHLRPLSREAGAEVYPALSPDGQRLVYAAGPGFEAPGDLFVRGTNLGDDIPTRITETPLDDESWPAWSPSGNRIAFIRTDRDGRCTLVVMTPPSGAERIAGHCGTSAMGLAWKGQNELVFADRLQGQPFRRLIVVDITTGRMRPITTPPADTIGDSAPVISADNRRIAFRRTAGLGSDDLHMLDLATGAERRLTHRGWKAAGFAWGPGATLLFTSNLGGDFGLWAMDVNKGDAPRRISLGTIPFGRISTDRSGRHLAVETALRNTHLAAIARDGTLRPLTADNGNDLDPGVAPNGAIAFVSDRSGTNELWVRSPEGRLVRLTRMGASFLYAPRWSADGRRIVFMAVVDGRTDLYIVQADGSGLKRLTDDGQRKGRAVWLSNSRELFYTVRSEGVWSLMRADAETGKTSPVPGTQGMLIVEGYGDRLFGRNGDGSRLIRLDLASGRPIARDAAIEELEAWAVAPDGLVEIRRGATGTPADIWLTPWSGAARRIASLRVPQRANPAVAANGDIIVPHAIADEGDLVLISLDR